LSNHQWYDDYNYYQDTRLLLFVFYIHAGIEQLIFFLWKVCCIVLFIAICLFLVLTVSIRMWGIFTSSTFEETISTFMTNSFTNKAIWIDVSS
jgi:uncharacterized membrane protein